MHQTGLRPRVSGVICKDSLWLKQHSEPKRPAGDEIVGTHAASYSMLCSLNGFFATAS